MADEFYYSFPLVELASVSSDFYGDRETNCIECGSSVPLETIWQCEYGFCGKLVCEDCGGFRCLDCDGNVDRLSYCFCRDHADVLRPKCSKCEERHCPLCTQVTLQKCEDCYRILCSHCEREMEEESKENWLCSRCKRDKVKSLQDTCRLVIRKSLMSRKRNSSDREQLYDPSQKLPLPTPLKKFLLYQ